MLVQTRRAGPCLVVSRPKCGQPAPWPFGKTRHSKTLEFFAFGPFHGRFLAVFWPLCTENSAPSRIHAFFEEHPARHRARYQQHRIPASKPKLGALSGCPKLPRTGSFLTDQHTGPLHTGSPTRAPRPVRAHSTIVGLTGSLVALSAST